MVSFSPRKKVLHQKKKREKQGERNRLSSPKKGKDAILRGKNIEKETNTREGKGKKNYVSEIFVPN